MGQPEPRRPIVPDRRDFPSETATGTIAVRPFARPASAGDADSLATDGGTITLCPVSHAPFVMETPAGLIYGDPVGEASDEDRLPLPDLFLILITNAHGDDCDAGPLAALTGAATHMITHPAVRDILPEDL